MTLNQDSCYHALKTHDIRFDGRFFVGVSSTGIYCRPVCTARLPKRENCTFFLNAAAAEGAGYRPCLRCRPELAPGNAPIDAVSHWAQTAAGLWQDNLLSDVSVNDIATQLGVSDRHLRRVFRSEYEYIAMRALAWPDAFMPTDAGVRKALGGVTAREAEPAATVWQPWRSYAVMHLWRSLEQRQ